MQAVSLGSSLEFRVMVIAVVAYVLNVVGQVIEVGHFVEHGGRYLRDGPVDILGTDIDFPVYLVFVVPDFVYTAIRRYSDGRAGHFPVIKTLVNRANISSVFFTISDICSMISCP